MFKKIISSIMALAIMASIGTTVMAGDVVSISGSSWTTINIYSGEVLANLKPVGIRASIFEVTENSVRLRATPSLSGTILGQLQKGDIVESAGHIQETADGYVWEYIYSRRHSRNGWVAVNYLSDVG